MSGIEGKVIVITGAGSGIGRTAACLLADRGAKLVLAGRNGDALRTVSAEIIAAGGTARTLVTDVTRRDDVAALVSEACAAFGRLDVLISNAGIGPISKFEEVRLEDWEAMVDIHIKGFLYGIAAALPVFRNQGFGHFVTTISTAGLKVSPTVGVYAATKNAVRTLCEGLRIESEGKYRVTAISPGFVSTNFAHSMTDPAIRMRTQQAMDSMALDTDAVARAMVFAIEQPDTVDIGDIILRPTVQD